MGENKLISVVIPAYNEEAALDALGAELKQLMARHPRYDFEIIVVENGSEDRSYDKLAALHDADPRFKVVQLSRNFSADGGVCAGLRHARGHCAVLMDADLQDPPEIIDQFLARWEQGADVVYGIIRSRAGISPGRRLLNGLFYRVLNGATRGRIPRNVTAFRLMDRRVYRALNRMPETNRFTRGLCAWTGFRQEGVEFDRAARRAGESKAGGWDVLREATDALVSFSQWPLRLVTLAGLASSAAGIVMLGAEGYLAWRQQRAVSGTGTVIIVLLFLFSGLFFALGIIGEYLGRLLDEVKRRPIYLVRRRLGFDSSDPEEQEKTGW